VSHLLNAAADERLDDPILVQHRLGALGCPLLELDDGDVGLSAIVEPRDQKIDPFRGQRQFELDRHPRIVRHRAAG